MTTSVPVKDTDCVVNDGVVVDDVVVGWCGYHGRPFPECQAIRWADPEHPVLILGAPS